MMSTLEQLVGIISEKIDKKVDSAVQQRPSSNRYIVELEETVRQEVTEQMEHLLRQVAGSIDQVVRRVCAEEVEACTRVYIERHTLGLQDELVCAKEQISDLKKTVTGLTNQLELHRIRSREETNSAVEAAKREIQDSFEAEFVPLFEARVARQEKEVATRLGAVSQLEMEAHTWTSELQRLGQEISTLMQAREEHYRSLQCLNESLQAQESASMKKINALEALLEETRSTAQSQLEAIDHRMSAGISNARKERESEAALRRDTEEMLKMCEATASRDREVSQNRLQQMEKQVNQVKELVLKGMRSQQECDQQASKQAEGLLKEYAGNIAGQVAKAMNVAISVRIQENNQLVDAALRARIPEYAKHAEMSVARVRDPLTGAATLVPHTAGDTQAALLAKAAMQEAVKKQTQKH